MVAIKLILEQDVDLDAQNSLGYNTFSLAVSRGYEDIVDLLMEARFESETEDGSENEEDVTESEVEESPEIEMDQSSENETDAV